MFYLKKNNNNNDSNKSKFPYSFDLFEINISRLTYA